MNVSTKVSVTVEVNGSLLVMSMEDARALRDELVRVLGPVPAPQPQPAPIFPRPPCLNPLGIGGGAVASFGEGTVAAR